MVSWGGRRNAFLGLWLIGCAGVIQVAVVFWYKDGVKAEAVPITHFRVFTGLHFRAVLLLFDFDGQT
jgi:hypothetical protein